MPQTLIRAGHVITMDSPGDLAGGEVLIEDGKIKEVGRNLEAAPGAEVVEARNMIALPGFVDAHLHTWQTGIRGIAGDWTIAQYLKHMHTNTATRFTPDDIYIGNLVGALNQINGGVTSLFDWCHNNPLPEHSDRAIDGLEESGIRALFGHGTPKPDLDDGVPVGDRLHPRSEVERLRRERLADDGALVTMGMVIRGPDISSYEATVHDISLARDFGMVASAHIVGYSNRVVPEGLSRLAKEGHLGPWFNGVHLNRCSDGELKALVDAGGTATTTPEVEMQMGHGLPVTGRVRALGGSLSIGVDVESNISGDMFTVMRMALQIERGLANQRNYVEKGEQVPEVAIATREALSWATIEAARAMGMADRVGSLAPGKQADLILIRMDDLNLYPVNNPLETVVYQAAAANVDSVYIAGRAVKKGGKLLCPDLQAKKEALAESGRRLLREAGLSAAG